MSITSKATSSVRSSVLNLSEKTDLITYEKTIELLIKSFFQWNNENENNNYDYIDPLLYYEQIKNYENELKSEKFLYQTSPPFVYTIENKNQSIEMTVTNGVINEIKGNDMKQFLGQLFHSVYNNIQKICPNKKISLPR
jgi:hypothetical protein